MLALLLAALFALVSGAAAVAQLKDLLREWHNLRVLRHRLAAWEIMERYIAARQDEARRN